MYEGSVLIAPVPPRAGEFEREIEAAVQAGARVLLYGPVADAGTNLLHMLNLAVQSPLAEEMNVRLKLKPDELSDGRGIPYPGKIRHRRLVSGGGIEAVLADNADTHTEVLMEAGNEHGSRIAAVSRAKPEWNGGKVVWIRGANSCAVMAGEWLPEPDDPCRYFAVEQMMRLALDRFGCDFRFVKRTPASKSPVTMVHRSKNAFYFSGYAPDTTVTLKMRFPFGVPLLVGRETAIEDGCAVYPLTRSWRNECRVFAEQREQTVLSCIEYPPVSHYLRRRILVSGLNNATLRIFPETGWETRTELKLNSKPEDHLTGDPIRHERIDSPRGTYMEVCGVTGDLLISTP